jgi:hypothetical protein
VFLQWHVAPRAAFATAAVLLTLASGASDVPFIYFQF